MKICTKCGKEKDLSSFYKRVASKDGLTHNCISCYREYRQSDENKKNYKAYKEAGKFRESYNKYMMSEKGKAYKYNYRRTDKYRKASAEATRKFRSSEEGKE